MDQSEPQEGINTHKQRLAMLRQQCQHERHQNEAGEGDFDRVELGWQLATARQQCQCGRETVAIAATQYASDAIAHQNMHRNQNANETTARHAVDAIAHQNMHHNQIYNETTAQCTSDNIAHQNMCQNQTTNETMAWHASDSTAHQNMRHNQNDNKAAAQRAANAEQHCVQRQAEEAEVRYQHWQLDAQRH